MVVINPSNCSNNNNGNCNSNNNNNRLSNANTASLRSTPNVLTTRNISFRLNSTQRQSQPEQQQPKETPRNSLNSLRRHNNNNPVPKVPKVPRLQLVDPLYPNNESKAKRNRIAEQDEEVKKILKLIKYDLRFLIISGTKELIDINQNHMLLMFQNQTAVNTNKLLNKAKKTSLPNRPGETSKNVYANRIKLEAKRKFLYEALMKIFSVNNNDTQQDKDIKSTIITIIERCYKGFISILSALAYRTYLKKEYDISISFYYAIKNKNKKVIDIELKRFEDFNVQALKQQF